MSIEPPPRLTAYSDKNPPPQNRQILTFLGLFLGTIVLIVWLAGWVINNVVWLIPPGVEQQLGQVIVPTYEALAEPSATQEGLNALLDRLESHLSGNLHTGRDYQVLYIPEETVNAIAIPGDRIIIYQGLLAEMDSENELMMVLGHELGHFANRDHLRGLSRQLALQLILAAVLGDVGSIGTIASSATTIVANAQLSQQQEYQADEVGLTLLQQEYGQVAGATDLFAALAQKQTHEPGADLAILATHPTPAKRVQRLEQLIKKNGYDVGVRSPLPSQLE